MKCQRCQKREATVLIKQSVNGNESEILLCQECLAELGFANSIGFAFNNLFGSGASGPQSVSSANAPGLTGLYNSGVFVSGKKDEKVCRHCGTTLDEFRKKGRLGCSRCYETFDEQLGQIFRRIQSGDKHRGRRLVESKEKIEIDGIQAAIEELQGKIKAAVDVEDYESAARWKVEIAAAREKIEKLKEKTKGADAT